MSLPELGDDLVDVPNPVTETPPPDRFCDLVLTGGVASGVVYPWAVVELARSFNFKSIGGTSVGAMAAALTAAAEYGRRCGAPGAFEVMRRLPGQLAEDAGDGRARLLALFQPAPRGARLFERFVDFVRVFASGATPRLKDRLGWLVRSLWAFRHEAALAALIGAVASLLGCALLGVLTHAAPANARGLAGGFAFVLTLLIAGLTGVAGLVVALLRDVREGLIANDLGLVRGGPIAGRAKDDPGLVAWLHEGIQRSAGLNPDDPKDAPLTFRDLWRAPAFAGAPPRDAPPGDARRDRSINLSMVTTNVTHGRPYRLPLDDETSRLYFDPDELAPFFPDDVMRALLRAGEPYRPRSRADPPAERGAGLFELPHAELPIVVAARLSLSFPVLFAALPLYAVDYEMPMATRTLKRCRFSDGGLCSNFPIHLFDAAAPRWPTFGMWLDKRGPYHDGAVWLPDNHLSGRGDSWSRFEPAPPWRMLFGFLGAAFVSAKNWSDRSSMRMPQVRTRVARLNLRPGEGELNIAMPRARILAMAQTYGTAAGLEFTRQFVEAPGAAPTAAWREHQWVRLHTLLDSLRAFLDGLGRASHHAAHSEALRTLIEQAMKADPLRRLPSQETTRQPITPEQAAALAAMLDAAERLETALHDDAVRPPYRPVPMPELRVRPPV